MSTGFIYDSRFLDHDTGPNHPEQPGRIQSAMKYIGKQPWHVDLINISSRSVDDQWLRTIHSGEYIARVEAACREGQPFLDSMDVAISRKSYGVARLAAGSLIALADSVVEKTVSNGFALLRPPGHHAESDTALGFCLFNNVAITARYLQRAHFLEKIAIVDWDVHHGNGTQHAFDTDPSVLYISTHQYPYYPGTGAYDEQGSGRGKGSIVNCPMSAGATDSDYMNAFSERILPALELFKPDALIISAGFDAHVSDPLAEISLSTDFFAWMTLRLMEIADKHADGRIVSVLEGGYNLSTIGECVGAHLTTLLAADEPPLP